MTDITKTLLTGASRTGALSKYFGERDEQFQICVYTLIGRYCPSYQPTTSWDYYALSNGGFFISIPGEDRIVIIDQVSGLDETMTPENASILFNLLAIKRLLRSEDLSKTNAAHLRGLFSNLRDFVLQSDESDTITRLID